MVLLSARKLQFFGSSVFLSRPLTKKEAERENLPFVRRCELLRQGENSGRLGVGGGVVYIRNSKKWTLDGKNYNKSAISETSTQVMEKSNQHIHTSSILSTA